MTSAGNVHPIESSLLTHHPTLLNGACMNVRTNSTFVCTSYVDLSLVPGQAL